jgi:hypothetical protein
MAADRNLWIWVIAQALDDAAVLPVTAPQYDEAIAFLSSDRPYWRQARAEVAAHLDLHADAIARMGRRFLADHPRAAVVGPRADRIDPALARHDGTPLSDDLRDLLKLRHHVQSRRKYIAA